MPTDKENLNVFKGLTHNSLSQKAPNLSHGIGLEKMALKDTTNVKESNCTKSLATDKLQTIKYQKNLPILSDSSSERSMSSQPTEQAGNLSTSGPKVRVENDCRENIPSSSATSYTFANSKMGLNSSNFSPWTQIENNRRLSKVEDEKLMDFSVNYTFNSSCFKPKTPDKDFETTEDVSYSRQNEAQNLTEEVVQSASWTESSSPSTSDAKCGNTVTSLELCADRMDEPRVLSNPNIGSEESHLVVPVIATEARGELLQILPSSVKNNFLLSDITCPFSDTTDISVWDATVSVTNSYFSSPPKTPASMKLEEEVISSVDVDKPIAAESNVTQTMSLSSSSSLRVSLNGTHNISVLEDEPGIKQCGIQNQTVEMSETASPMTDAECDSKIMQDTFNLCRESTEDRQTRANSTMTLPKQFSTTELPQTNVKTLSTISNTLIHPLNSTTTFLETVNPLNNTFEAHTSNLNVATTEIEKLLTTFETCPPEQCSVATTVDDANELTATHPNKTFETNMPYQVIGTTTETNSQRISHQNVALEAKPSMTILSTTVEAEASIKMIRTENNTFDTQVADVQSSVKLRDTFSAESVKMGTPQNETFEDPMFSKLDSKTTTMEGTVTVSHRGTEAEDNIKTVGLSNTADEAQIPLSLTGTKAEDDKNLRLPQSITPPSVPVEEFTTDVDNSEQNIHSMPDRSWKDSSDSLCNQSVETETNKVAFILDGDGSLELGSSSARITSTPMPNSRVPQFKFEWEGGKTPHEQQKRYSDVLLKPTLQLPAASNIISDKKTFFKPGALTNTRSLKPPSRPASHLPTLASLKITKTATSTSGTSEPPVCALPDARRITRATASRNETAAVSQEGSVSASGVHAAIPESRLPSIGLRKRQTFGLQSGIQRSLPPPVPVPEKASIVSSNDKPSGIAAALRSKSKTVQTHNQGEKHLLTSSEAFPLAKRKKLGPPSKGAVPSASTQPVNPQDDEEILGQSSSHGAQMCTSEPAKGARILKKPASSLTAGPRKQKPGVKQVSGTFTSKHPTKAICQAALTPRGAVPPVSSQPAHSPDACANCLVLQQELEQCRQELKRVQEELRNRNQMDL